MESATRVSRVGVLIAGCAGVAGLLALSPASDVDLMRMTSPVLPLMLVPLIVAWGLAGLLIAVRPAWMLGGISAAVVTALQVAGIAAVASRDWQSYAAADGTSYVHGRVAAYAAIGMGIAAAAAVMLGMKTLWRSTDARQVVRNSYRSIQVWLGVGVAVVLPFTLMVQLGYHNNVNAVAQFALWWSLPWGVGLVAAGLMRSWRERFGVWLSIAYSVLLAVGCALVPLIDGTALRLPG